MITKNKIEELVINWYKCLDVHAPLIEVLGFLAKDGLEMRFPESTIRTETEFAGWYETVTNKFFDEAHDPKITSMDIVGDTANVQVLVNWKASTWTPPEPCSEKLNFDAYQTWVVKEEEKTGKPLILTYIVDKLEPIK